MDLSDLINNEILNSEVEIDCPNCDKEFSIVLSQVGSIVQCPFCKTDIELKDNF